MIYDLSMPYEDFLQADSLVRGVTRRCQTRELSRITQDSLSLDFEHWQYIQDNPEALAVTFLDRGAKEFDIWISPSFRYWDSPWTLDTLLHELVHGYAGAMDHGQRFRRTFITVLHRYENEVQPVKADYMARRTVNRYSQDEWQTRQFELEFCKKAALEGLVNA